MVSQRRSFCLLFAFLFTLVAFSAAGLAAQQEPPQSQPEEAAEHAASAPPDTTPYSPFVKWVRSLFTIWIILPIVAIALAFWFARISTSSSRDPSKNMP